MKVELRNAARSYGQTCVFEGQDLILTPGSLVAVHGDNGQGKTTLLESLYGMQELDNGELLWDNQGFDRHDLALRRRAFYMPDSPPIKAHLDGLSQIAEWFSVWEVNDSAAIQSALDLLDEFRVLEEAGKQLSSLSRGQTYKVALSGLLSLNADLWLLDEPLASGMDSKGIGVFQHCCRAAILKGKTIVYTTQLEELAQSFSTHVCHIENGSMTLREIL